MTRQKKKLEEMREHLEQIIGDHRRRLSEIREALAYPCSILKYENGAYVSKSELELAALLPMSKKIPALSTLSVKNLCIDGSQRVSLEFKDGNIYQGRVIGFHYTRGFLVEFDDGDQGEFTPDQLKPIASWMKTDDSHGTTEQFNEYSAKWELLNYSRHAIRSLWNKSMSWERAYNKLRREDLSGPFAPEPQYIPTITLRREHVIEDVFKSCIFSSTKDLESAAMQIIEVKYKGEKGIDRGGPLREMYALFYDQSDEYYVDSPHFLEILKSHETYFIKLQKEGTIKANKIRLFKAADKLSTMLLPTIFCDRYRNEEKIPLTKDMLQLYYNFGRFWIRTVLEDDEHEVRVPSRFLNNIFIDYILDITSRYLKKSIPEIISDIVEYDPILNWISKLYDDQHSITDQHSVTPTVGNLLNSEDCTPLSSEDVWRKCLICFVTTRIIEPRREQLEAIKNGFFLLADRKLQKHTFIEEENFYEGFNIRPYIELCSSSKEIQQLISTKEEKYDADRIMELVSFQDFGKNEDQQKQFFYEAMDCMTQEEIREIITFITAWPYLPSRSRKGKHYVGYITIQLDSGEGGFNRFPSSSTCDKKLLLPAYRTANEMKTKLLEATRTRQFFNK